MDLGNIIDGKVDLKNIMSLKELNRLEGFVPHYSNLFSSLARVSHIGRQKNPIKFALDLRYHLFELLEFLFENQVSSATLILIKMYAGVEYARQRNILAQAELKPFSDTLEKAINMSLSFSSMENEGINIPLFKVLLPETTCIQRDHENLMMLALQRDGLLETCLSQDIKTVFSNLNVVLLVKETFWASSRKISQFNTASGSNNLYMILENSRYCPGAMFILKALSSLVIFMLTTSLI